MSSGPDAPNDASVPRIALYRMSRNSLLGPCLAVGYRPDDLEVASDSLQSPFVLAIIKTRIELPDDISVDRLAQVQLFAQDSSDDPVLLRVASECLLGAFGDQHCDCEEQRIACLREIERAQQGIYIHLPQEAKGQGLVYKLHELRLQVDGVTASGVRVGVLNVNQAASYLLAGDKADRRRYAALAGLVRVLGLERYRYALLTASPEKGDSLGELGLTITSTYDARHAITIENVGEYIAKLFRGYRLTPVEIEQIRALLESAPEIPDRVQALLDELRRDVDGGRLTGSALDEAQLLVAISARRGRTRVPLDDAAWFKDADAYDEYQIELAVKPHVAVDLRDAGILTGLEFLRYEENHFYDLAGLERTSARSVKVRTAYKLPDRKTPTEIRVVVKTQLRERVYRVRSQALSTGQHQVIHSLLRGYERHIVPVFTHGTIIGAVHGNITLLIKRYNTNLRTLAIMGAEHDVVSFVEVVRKCTEAEPIDDPTTFRYVRPEVSAGFDFHALAAEELSLFRQFALG